MRRCDRESLNFVKTVRRFGEDVLSLDFGGSFRRLATDSPLVNWLYAVHRDRLQSALSGGATFRVTWDIGKARRWQRYYESRGHDTYLYRAEAHGGPDCPITTSLLRASPARCAYVILHEGWHTTLRINGFRMPYPLEEATGRIVGVFGTILFAQRSGDDELLDEAEDQMRAWHLFVRFINTNCRRLTALYSKGAEMSSRDALFDAIRSDAERLIERMPPSWERNELSKKLNNAFFFRYKDYTAFYPLALKVYNAAGSLIRAMSKFKTAAKEGAPRMLRAYIRESKSKR